MREITDIKEMQKIELDVLKFIDEICEKYGIKYSLAYGTLIGAVRNRGFIPWDDDVDIMMLRKDYDRFCKVMKNEYGRYQLLCIENTPNYESPLAKVIDTDTLLIEYSHVNKNYELGIYVDIFPMDNIADTDALMRLQFVVAQTLLSIWSSVEFKLDSQGVLKQSKLKYLVRKLCFGVSKIINLQRVAVKCLRKVCRLFNNRNCTRVGLLSFSDNVKLRFSKAWLSEYEIINFENTTFPCIKEYDQLLKWIYGDYMTLPPVEQRVSNHSFVAYWKD